MGRPSWRGLRLGPLLSLLALAVVLLPRPVLSAPSSGPVPASAADAIRLQYSFAHLGADYRMSLVAPQSELGLPFGLAADLVPEAATLSLAYRVVDRPPPGQARLVIRLNGIEVQQLDIRRQDAGQWIRQPLTLPAQALVGFNHLEMVLQSDAPAQCVPGQDAQEWLEISPDSQIQVEAQRVALANDLSLWPLPFFDEHTVDPLQLTLAFDGQPDMVRLQSAGLLASWLGQQAGYRGTELAVAESALPADRNVIALLTAGQQLPGVKLPPLDGPRISIRDLPGGQGRKLLLLTGRNEAELQMAVRALVQGASMSGPFYRPGHAPLPPARRPYDAPNWLPLGGRWPLGRLSPARRLDAHGPFPQRISLDLSLPPDLYAADRKALPLDLHYAATASSRHRHWQLGVMLNAHPIAVLPLAGASDPAVAAEHAAPLVPHHRRLSLPLADFAGHDRLHFSFDFQQRPGCTSPAAAQATAGIDPGSTLDLSGWQHYLVMPDLAAFANSGFPFSRLADLADTAVVLPDQPDPQTLATGLNLLAQIGADTGYPAYRVHFTSASGVDRYRHDDLLVLGSAASQPLFAAWARQLPTYQGAASLHRAIQRWMILHVPARWRHVRRPDLPSTVGQHFDAEHDDALLMGLQSPLDPARSVLAVQTLHPGGAAPLLQAFRDPAQLARIQGSVTALRQGRLQSFVGLQSYGVGSLGRWTRWIMELSERPWLTLTGMLLLAALAALLLRHSLRRVAAHRLNESVRDD